MAFSLSRLIASLLYGVSATDPVTFIGVALLLTIVALSRVLHPCTQSDESRSDGGASVRINKRRS
ncbi:MAG: hypothetical protein WKF84_09700 [Pyrinomonadaceae bacterium]